MARRLLYGKILKLFAALELLITKKIKYLPVFYNWKIKFLLPPSLIYEAWNLKLIKYQFFS
jgi:hypothetical protein